jgi:hypothetical protein
MGPRKDDLSFDRNVEKDWVILVPAGSWHNVTTQAIARAAGD